MLFLLWAGADSSELTMLKSESARSYDATIFAIFSQKLFVILQPFLLRPATGSANPAKWTFQDGVIPAFLAGGSRRG
jgi:hypothetical protein